MHDTDILGSVLLGVIPAGGADTRLHLRFINRHLPAVPQHRLNTYGCQAFSVAGATVWNSFPDFIWDPPTNGECFRRFA